MDGRGNNAINVLKTFDKSIKLFLLKYCDYEVPLCEIEFLKCTRNRLLIRFS